MCERETAEVKADCCESVGDSEEKKRKEFMSVFVCIDDPAYTRFSVCACVCVCANASALLLMVGMWRG